MKARLLVWIVLLALVIVACGDDTPDNEDTGPADSTGNPTGSISPRLLYINSYHEGYPPSDGLEIGIHSGLDETGIEWMTHRMDTKNNPDEDFKQQAAEEVRDLIETYQPEVVIVSDDNAFKYVVQQYYRDADLPFVFVGVNWDIEQYGGPYRNTTGMLEVALIPQIVANLEPYAAGERLGYMAGDLMSERNTARYAQEMFDLRFDHLYFVTDFDEWQQAFVAAQDQVDILIFENTAGIAEWDDAEAEAFVAEHIRIPVGATNDYMMPYAILGITRVYEEQGAYAAEVALDILNGADPAAIPVTYNQSGKVFLNMELATQLGIIFPIDLVDQGTIIS